MHLLFIFYIHYPLGGDGMTPRYPKYNSWSVAARTTELMHADYNGFEKAGKSIKKAKHHNTIQLKSPSLV